MRIKVKFDLVISIYNMLKLKLFSNYYIFLEKVSILVNYMSFATKTFNIFKSLIENVSVGGEDKRGKMHVS